MKKRVLSLLLALSMALSTVAVASDALGWELHKSVTTLGPGTTLTEQLLWGDSKSDYRREFYLTYTPNASVEPVVAYGSTVLSTNTVTALARSIESTGKRVLGGANGDYFVMATGAPLGLVVTDGVMRSSSSYHYALAFDESGKAVIGEPGVRLWADFSGYHLLIGGGYNKSRTLEGGMTLFSADFGSTTRTKSSGIDIVLRPVTIPEGFTFPALETETVWVDAETGEVVENPDQTGENTAQSVDNTMQNVDSTMQTVDDMTQSTEKTGETQTAVEGSESRSERALRQETRYTQTSKNLLYWASQILTSAPAELRLASQVDCVVEQVLDGATATAIPEGCFVLSLDSTSPSEFHKTELKNLQLGQKVTISVTAEEKNFTTAKTAIGAYTLLLRDGEVQEGLSTSADPRTAVGVKADGSVILYALDGRQSGYSVGGSVKQVAQRLKELGCVDAALFDGGGSTTLGTTDAVGDSFAVVNQPSEGSQRAVTNGLFFVSNLTATGVPGSLYVESGEEILLSGGQTALSAQLIDTGYYPMKTTAGNVSYSASSGSVNGSVFTAGTEAGTVVITAAATVGEEENQRAITGQTLLTTVSTPHTISVTDEATGGAVTALSLDPGETVSLRASATWRKLALKSRDECFTWTVTEGLGTIDAGGTLTAGSRGGSGSVNVTAGDKTVTIPLVVGGHVNTLDDCEGVEQFTSDTAQVTLDTRNVKFGTGAVKIDYPAGESRVELNRALPEGDSYFGFWAMGLSDELHLWAEVELSDGTSQRQLLCNRAYGGWKQLLLQVGDEAARVTALILESEEAGTLTVDQFISANDGIYDTTAPTAQLTLTAGTLRATIQDNVDKTFSTSQITLTEDGKAISFAVTDDTVTAQVSTDGKPHRYSLTVSDASGNLARAGLSAGSGGISPFVDTAGHWAEEYAAYLYDHGVTQGYVNGQGLVFEPGKNITRGEFATMLGRWMGLDLSRYEAVELPFADAADIPTWALGGIRALYAEGIFTGSAEAGGLYALADQPITRAQAIAMLGRVLPRGFATAGELFDDDGDIPLWASEYIYLLAGQGVVSGFNGLVRPNDPITRGEVAKLLTVMW